MPTDTQTQLTKYLTDAHAIETQALAQLRRAPDIAGDPDLARAFEQHLAETEEHERLVRALLDERGASPATLKELVMRVGGVGFLLFAKLQPDTPGKLAAHAYSYEHLELAGYELLAAVARAAGESAVAETAERIRLEEKAMGERLAGCFDRAVDASLRNLGADDFLKRLQKYLSDAHAIEPQAIALLERGPKIAGYEELKRVAQRAGDDATVALAERILGEERTAAAKLSGVFERTAEASLEAVGAAR